MKMCERHNAENCKKCARAAYMRQWLASRTPEQKAAINARQRKYQADMPAEKKRQETLRKLAHIKKNRTYYNMHVNSRKKRMKYKRPKWADLKAIYALYEEARRLTKTTGVLYTVDHIVLLNGQNVCGLHVENNLQVLPGKENDQKGNKLL